MEVRGPLLPRTNALPMMMSDEPLIAVDLPHTPTKSRRQGRHRMRRHHARDNVYSESSRSRSSDSGRSLTPSSRDDYYISDEESEAFEKGMKPASKDLHRMTAHKPWRESQMKELEEAATTTKTRKKYALIIRRQARANGDAGFQLHSIDVQSPLIREVLRKTFSKYRGLDTKEPHLILDAPFHPFAFRWQEFQEEISKVTDDATNVHCKLLKDVLDPEITALLKTKEELLAKSIVSYEYLWILFEPDTIVYTNHNGYERAFQVLAYDYGKRFFIEACGVDRYGAGYGVRTHTFAVNPFQGTVSIMDLEVAPLNTNPHREEIKERLIARGRHWEEYNRVHHVSYTGAYRTWNERKRGTEEVYVDDARIMIDQASYNMHSMDFNIILNSLKLLEPCDDNDSGEADTAERTTDSPSPPYDSRVIVNAALEPPPYTAPPLTEAQLLLCTVDLNGYCLTKKKWVTLQLPGVSEIIWNDRAFDNLVLPHEDKDILYAFVDSQINHMNLFDDIISGKGRGVVILLSGDPGVGKTLTAESIAEKLHRPLYNLSGAELGDTPIEVEGRLSTTLTNSAQWGAILLLDECDVFLAERTISDLARNKLVSVFLRLLEYYKGIMFLTTNRREAFDRAFESRIDLALEYPALDTEARLKIWKMFLGGSMDQEPEVAGDKASGSDLQAGLSGPDFERLSKIVMNGREIKNVVKVSKMLASRERRKVCIQDVEKVLRAKRLGLGAGETGSLQGGSKSDNLC